MDPTHTVEARRQQPGNSVTSIAGLGPIQAFTGPASNRRERSTSDEGTTVFVAGTEDAVKAAAHAMVDEGRRDG